MSQRRRGFTLIELLTTIAILGLLMAILFPSLSAARTRAKTNTCLSQLKGLGSGTAIYLTENKDVFFPVRLDKLHPTLPGHFFNGVRFEHYVNEFGHERPRWQWYIQTGMGPVINPVPFQREGRVPFGDETQARANPRKMTIDVFSCPALTDSEIDHDIRDGAFGYNYQYLGNTRTDTSPNVRWDNFSVGLHQIKSPSRTVTLADSRGAGPKHGPDSFMLDPPRLAIEKNAERFGPSAEYIDLDLPVPETQRYSPVEDRHKGMGNVVFVDAHGDTMTLKALGYEVNDPELNPHPGFPTGAPVPIIDPSNGPYKASNQMWNGSGIDEVAFKANPPAQGGP